MSGPICPECAQGKHQNCVGQAWDDATDQPVACSCTHGVTTDLMLPGSPEWCRRVSPSKAAAILGISPWDSQYSMWRKMRGDVPWDEENEAMERGTLLESGVLAWWRKHHPHDTWTNQSSFPIDDWCVATPDALTLIDDEPVLVEAKTSSNDDAWGDPGTDEIPAYYLVQTFLAAHVANLHGIPVRKIHVPVLGPRLRFANYVVEYDPKVGTDLMARMKAWYDSLSSEVPPPLDDTPATYDAVRRVHPEIDRGVEVQLTETEALALVTSARDVEDGEARARLARATAIERMGRAQYAVCNGVRIARRQPRGDSASFVLVAKTTDFTTESEPAA